MRSGLYYLTSAKNDPKLVYLKASSVLGIKVTIKKKKKASLVLGIKVTIKKKKKKASSVLGIKVTIKKKKKKKKKNKINK